MKTSKTMKSLKQSLAVIGLSTLMFGCAELGLMSKTKKVVEPPMPAIISIDSQAVPLDEFTYLYNKNYANNDSAYTETSLREYLDLFTKFKLKVKEAEAEGFAESSSFKKEFNGYKKQLAAPYLTDTKVTDELVKQAYDRMETEVKASHILIRSGLGDMPEDTLKAYNKLMDIRNRVVAGEDFVDLALELSEDPSAKQNKGSLGYFSALQMVYEFEEAAYTTKVGEVSMPIRTQFGYHLIKVHDKRPSQGAIRVAHIMIRAEAGLSGQDSATARNKIDGIYKSVKEGGDWTELCSQFSEDNGTANKGGELPWFTSAGMIESFSDAAFELTLDAPISEPIRTPFGWHIIKLLEKKPLESFEDMESQLRQKIAKDTRSQMTQRRFIERIKSEYNFKADGKEAALAAFDSTLSQSKWGYKGDPELPKKPLFVLGDTTVSIGAFFEYATKKQSPQRNMTYSPYANQLYEKFVDKAVMSYEESKLESKYPEYRHLVKEYRDGILLFNVMESKVWNKTSKDTVELRAFYYQNRESYRWGERVDVTIISASGDSILKSAVEDFRGGTFLMRNIRPTKIKYYYNKYKLTQAQKDSVSRLALLLKRYPAYKLMISSVTKRGESKTYLKRRHEAIASYLKENGLDSSRFTITVSPEQVAGRKNQANISFDVVGTGLKALASSYNSKGNALAINTKQGKYEKGANKLVSQAKWQVGEYYIQDGKRPTVVMINKILPSTNKELDKAKGQVISDYQNMLEMVWLKELQEKYKVDIHEDVLMGLIKKPLVPDEEPASTSGE